MTTSSVVAKVLRERGCEGKTLAIYMERNAACCLAAVGALMVHTKFVDVAAWNKPNDLVRIVGLVKPDVVITSKACHVTVTAPSQRRHSDVLYTLHYCHIAITLTSLTVPHRCSRSPPAHLQGAAAQSRDHEIGGRDRTSADPCGAWRLRRHPSNLARGDLPLQYRHLDGTFARGELLLPFLPLHGCLIAVTLPMFWMSHGV